MKTLGRDRKDRLFHLQVRHLEFPPEALDSSHKAKGTTLCARRKFTLRRQASVSAALVMGHMA